LKNTNDTVRRSMIQSDDLLRVDVTGTIHPVGRVASQQLRVRAGDWGLLPSPHDLLLLRKTGPKASVTLKLAGEIRSPGALSDVIAFVAQSSWNGELLVLSEKGARSLYFEGGNLLGVTTSVPEERFGETLYRFGVVTRAQLEAAVEASATTGKRLGEAV